MAVMELTVVLPCLNEARTVGASVTAALRFLSAQGLSGTVLVADNGSTDGSVEVAAASGATVVSIAGRGYGFAVMGGVRAATSPYVAMLDCDGSYDVDELALFVRDLADGADLVVGDRFGGAIEPGAMPWPNRLLGTPALSYITRSLHGGGVRDVNCGMRAFRRDAILDLGLRAGGMEFAVEMVAASAQRGYAISQRPIGLRRDGRGGRASHLRPWRDGARQVRLLVEMRVRRSVGE